MITFDWTILYQLQIASF